MSAELRKPSAYVGGAFFRPSDHINDVALLIEPKRVDRGVSNTYNGETRLRDEVYADITVFATSESVETGRPTAVLENARVVHGMLTDLLAQIIGSAMVGIVRKIPTRKGQGYAFRDVEPSIEAAVTAYLDSRETAVAAALASGAMPSFDANMPSFG
ncbi:hypothetical protein [Paractinoplanes rishiriensis]|uniref:Uncharacterized protein n=1 Tax=Paractinoplanes rishiriensis TaxID=1050105 RepID=A0A919KBN5_9ACTN|nr:hypothetical protein [Actinoplanes rishiriensis]GIF02244.1 hypothetical protein Ari01nite_97080 [Actinoplanes rishiriensis]